MLAARRLLTSAGSGLTSSALLGVSAISSAVNGARAEGQVSKASAIYFRCFASNRRRQPEGPASAGPSWPAAALQLAITAAAAAAGGAQPATGGSFSNQRTLSAVQYAVAQAVRSWAVQLIEEPSLEEVRLTGRARPALPAISPAEGGALADPDAWFESQLPDCGQGATLYPADHLLTKRAEAMRDEFLAAAQARIEERQGADSPPAARFRQQLAEGPPPVRVFGSKADNVGGLCGPGGILVSDRVDQMAGTMAHEAAHFILQHGSEPYAVIQYARSRALNQTSAVSGVKAAALELLRLRAWSASALLVPVHCWAVWRSWSGPRWDAKPESAGGALRENEQLVLLLPGDPDFDRPTRQALASRKMCTELEAERVALLLFAWTGRDPRQYVQGGLLRSAGLPLDAASWPTDRLCAALQAAAAAAEARRPGSLTAITASDSGGGSPTAITKSDSDSGGDRYLWPNNAKQLQNIAQHLPAAMAAYKEHSPS